MTTKPSYLGLLNAIAVAESQAEIYLDEWVKACQRDDVRQVLHTVARREGEHGKAFAKRIAELGFMVQSRVDETTAGKCAIASSTTLTDREKFEKIGTGQQALGEGRDIFASMMEDVTIDIATGALLGRYIAEEHDSIRLLNTCYRQLCAEEDAHHAPAASTADLDARLSRIERQLEEICALVAG